MHASQPGERSKQHAVRGQILCVMLRSAALFIYLFIDFNITVINYQVIVFLHWNSQWHKYFKL